jgi:hypothetical protein
VTANLRGPWARLRGPLLFGALARVIAAFSGFGYFASDDYTHVLAMAYKWLDGPAAYNSDIRSPLLARFVWCIFEALSAIGVHDPAWLVRWAYLVLGLVSLLTIPGTYVLAERRLGEGAATMAAWLVALEALMPRIVTRALISVVAMVPLVWGTALVDDKEAPWWRAALGGLLLGVAAMLRFQVGVIAITLAALVFVRAVRKRGFEQFGGLCLGGLAAVGLQALVGWSSVIAYVSFNSTGASRYGVSPWYTYALDFLALTVPPLTFWLAKPMAIAARKHLAVTLPFVVFVLVHSAIPHKEEHFIFAVLPYFFILLGAALFVSRVRVRQIFWTVNTLVLVPATLSDGHRSLTWPLLEAGRDGGFSKIVFVGKALIPDMYAAKTPVQRVLTPEEAESVLDNGRIRLLAERRHEMPDPTGWSCTEVETLTGDFVDQLLIKANPVNRRRAEKFVRDCEQP